MQWKTIVTYIDVETGEIIPKQMVEKHAIYRIIAKIPEIKYEQTETQTIKTINRYVRSTKQLRIEF